MTKYLHLKKIIAVFLAVILLLESSGCAVKNEIIKVYDIPVQSSMNYNYMILAHNSKSFSKHKVYFVDKLTFSGDSGQTRIKELYKSYNTVKIYVKADSLVKINRDGTIRIASNDIEQVKIEQIYPILFWGYFVLGVIGVFIIGELWGVDGGQPLI